MIIIIKIAYKNALKVVSLNGPTFFAQIINYVNNMVEYEVKECKYFSLYAKNSQRMNKYYILLIITDGLINDMDPTIDQIVRASGLPISIIIVGVGDQDFKPMDILDADEIPLFSKKFQKKMERDIVQFVPFRDFKNNVVELAKQTLEEIPRQLTSYMNDKAIKPMKADLLNKYTVSFFENQYEQFVKKLLADGFSKEKIDEILAKGLPEQSIDLFKFHAFNPYFRNPLMEQNVMLNNK